MHLCRHKMIFYTLGRRIIRKLLQCTLVQVILSHQRITFPKERKLPKRTKTTKILKDSRNHMTEITSPTGKENEQ